MSPVKVIICGAKGRMGRTLIACAKDDPELQVVAEIDQGAIGRRVGLLEPLENDAGRVDAGAGRVGRRRARGHSRAVGERPHRDPAGPARA